MLPAPEPLAYSIPAAVAATGNAISRTRFFELIATGQIESRKIGRRRVVLAASLRAFIENAPKTAA